MKQVILDSIRSAGSRVRRARHGDRTSVAHVKPGDLVINLQRENWVQKRRIGSIGLGRVLKRKD